MLSRRRFLAALAASVTAGPRALAAGPRPPSWLRPVPEAEWSYGQAFGLAIRQDRRVEFPRPRLPRAYPPLPPFDGAAVGQTLRSRFPDLRQRFAFEYYPWYGTNPWRHWNQWNRTPPHDLAVTSVPALGPYDSRDARVVEQHARWIVESGAGAVNISWWGRGSWEDLAVPLVMDVMRDHGLKVTFHLEPYNDSRTENYAGDIQYLLREYGDKRGWDCLLLVRDGSGIEVPVFKSFATLLPRTSTDCHGNTSVVSLWRPDSAWRQQTDLVRETFRRDFNRIYLLADSGALDRVKATGFDGIAMYDSFLRPSRWPGLAGACRDFGLVFSFNINSGFDGIAQRNVPLGSCYRPTPFEPPAEIAWDDPIQREDARRLSERRIEESLRMTLNVQTDPTLPDRGAGFFLVYINSFNEWHEGTAFEPARNHAALLQEEQPYGYHNAAIGNYRLRYLTTHLAPILGGD